MTSLISGGHRFIFLVIYIFFSEEKKEVAVQFAVIFYSLSPYPGVLDAVDAPSRLYTNNKTEKGIA